MTPQGLLVLDESFKVTFPRHFRSDLKTDLRFMASAQFSERTLIAVLRTMKEKVWLVDLRRESHGFVNGIPISWYGEENKSNIGLSTQTILLHEASALASLNKNSPILVSEIIKKSQGMIRKTTEFSLEVKTVETEAQLAKRLNVAYLRLSVLDHHRPDDAEVDLFVNFVKNLPSDHWLYFHCRGGKGRSSTFVLMYDILKNGKQFTLDEIAHRQIQLGSKDLLNIQEASTTAWKREAAMARKAFITQFYAYASSDEGYPRHNWSYWLKNHVKSID